MRAFLQQIATMTSLRYLINGSQCRQVYQSSFATLIRDVMSRHISMNMSTHCQKFNGICSLQCKTRQTMTNYVARRKEGCRLACRVASTIIAGDLKLAKTGP